MARKKLSGDQKRRKKLAKRNKLISGSIAAYRGNKYKSKQFVEAIFHAEAGIYEAYVITDRQLTDRQVEASLEYLICVLRGQQSSPPVDNPQAELQDGQFEDLAASSIQHHWSELFADRPRHSNADLVGVLRTILGSIEVWSRRGRDSRGYLHYIEGFLNKAGFHVKAVPASEMANEEQEDALEEAAPDSDEELLTELGDAWEETRDPLLKDKYFAQANALLKAGKRGPVIEVSQRLIGKVNDVDQIGELRALIQAAFHQEAPRRKHTPLRNWVTQLVSGWWRKA